MVDHATAKLLHALLFRLLATTARDHQAYFLPKFGVFGKFFGAIAGIKVTHKLAVMRAAAKDLTIENQLGQRKKWRIEEVGRVQPSEFLAHAKTYRRMLVDVANA